MKSKHAKFEGFLLFTICCVIVSILVGPQAHAVNCPAGFYNDNGVCKPADPGYYVPVAGATSPTICPPGTYTSAAGAIEPIPAAPGRYVSRPGATTDTICPVGTFAAGTGSIAPTPAQPGFFVSAQGATEPTPCPSGYYTSASGMSAPTPADPGFYVAAAGSSSQTQAPAGSYAQGPAATEFVECPAGTYAPAGSAAAILCAPGFYSAGGAAAPTPAPPGTFVSAGGAATPTPAPPGTYAPGPAATHAIPAPAGSFSPGNVAAPTLCSPGHYTPFEGMVAPLAAAPGYYVPGAGATAQLIVPAGNYAAGPAATSYIQSPSGTYAPAGSAAPIPCPGGYYAAAGASSPTICPAGSYAPFGSAAPILCPADHYAPEGSAAPIYCPGAPAGSTTCLPQNYNGSQLDFGDLQDTPYPTKLPTGARHVISPHLFLGAGPPDAESDGQASAGATGDDAGGVDDEDSVDPRALHAYKSTPFHLRVRGKNTTGNAAYLTVFIDWNNNGVFTDPNEVQQVAVASSTSEVSVLVHFSVPANAAVGSNVAMRLRFTTDQGVNAGGSASDGEVEDYLLPVANPAFDWSDLPDSVAGSVPGVWGSTGIPDYRTLASDNGPVHPILPGLWFANDSGTTALHIDAEADGQPTAASSGDNLGGDNDESPLHTSIASVTTVFDGIRSHQNVTLLASLAVENITGAAANAFGFIDVNADGDFSDPGEQSAPIVVPGDGSMTAVLFTFNFASPPMAPSSTVTFTNALRFRLSVETALSADGPATNGEVEDSLFTYSLTMPNYVPEQDWGDLPITYPTQRANNGARHNFTTLLTLGYSYSDSELDGQPSTNARGDDINSLFFSDETSFDPAAFSATPGMTGAQVPVAVANSTGFPAQVSVFIDWNGDSDFNDLNEISRVVEPTGTSFSVLNVPFDVPATASVSAPIAMRIRLSTEFGLGAGGLAPDGEVEDYMLNLSSPRDYGDLPAPYATTFAENGPRHVVSQTLFIGVTTPDLENDGQPNPVASGDDAGIDDEDGFSAPVFVAGQNVTLPVFVSNNTGSPAILTAFVDWDNNGTFTGLETHTLSIASTGTQIATFNFFVPPSTSSNSPLAVRFRLSTATGLTDIGPAPDGEVEDYLFAVEAASLDFGDLPDGYKTTIVSNGPQHAINAKLFLGSAPPDGELDGQPNTTAAGDDSNGADDENALAAALVQPHSGFDLNLIVNVTNDLAGPAYLYTFVDWDGNGVFNNTNESVRTVVPAGSVGVTVNPLFRVPLNATTTNPIAVRLRLTTEKLLTSTGPAPDGEVEDFFIPPAKQIIDYGDIQDASTATTGNGTAPGVVTNLNTVSQGDYRTMKHDLGPRHVARQDLAICQEEQPPESAVDGEDDAHPNSTADGDNLDMPALPNGGGPVILGEDDENRLNLLGHVLRQIFDPATLTFTIAYIGNVAVRNETGDPAYLSAFIDSNNDGDFDDTDEAALTIGQGAVALIGAGPNFRADLVTNYTTPDPVIPSTDPGALPNNYSFVFVVKAQLPPTDTGIRGFTKKLPIRLRLSTTPGLGSINTSLADPIPDGEVEDHIIEFSSAFDNPYPQPADFGDLPAVYHTKLADNGPRHTVTTDLFLGELAADEELDGTESPNATGDDAIGVDDENALDQSNPVLIAGGENRLHVKVTNSTSSDTWVWGFADWNHDGDFADAFESISEPVGPSLNSYVATLNWRIPADANTGSPTAMRLRISSTAVLGPDGPAPNGEVEDSYVQVHAPGSLVDHGDLPDTIAGTAVGVHGTGSPPDYQTRAADGGPTHPLIAGLGFANLGSLDADYDGEADALPFTIGDDGDQHDDEEVLGFSAHAQDPISGIDLLVGIGSGIRRDGIHTEIDMLCAMDQALYNATGNPVWVYWFADLNNNGTFSDVDDFAANTTFGANELRDDYGDGINNYGTYVTGFTVTLRNLTPATTFSRTYAIRTRISSDDNLSAIGPASDGEVEDYVQTFTIEVPADTFDNPDYGDLPPPYKTLHVDNGARHLPSPNLFMGSIAPEGEIDGQPHATAAGDDNDGTDDEDGFSAAALSPVVGLPVALPVAVKNTTGNNAELSAFVDWNGDGDFLDAEETKAITVLTGTVAGVNVPMNVPATAVVGTPIGVRLRLSTEYKLTALGVAPDGEVEDYFISVAPPPIDFGDLPAPYPTLLADDGARHSITPDLYMGNLGPDVDANGQPTSGSDGDDAIGSDDEDGLISPVIIAGGSNNLSVKTTNSTGNVAYLLAFADWNQDGDFGDANETANALAPIGSTTVLLTFNVPANAVTTAVTAIRLRLSSEDVLGPTGSAPDGEVEDYLVPVHQSGGLIDYGDLPDLISGTAAGAHGSPNPPDYRTKANDNGPSHVIVPGIGFANIAPSGAAYIDAEVDGQPASDAKGDDNNAHDDENGVVVTYGALATTVIKDGAFSEADVTVQFRSAIWNATPSVAYTAHFFDTNNNGSFDDASDTVVRQNFTSAALGAYPPGVGNVGFVFDTAVLRFKNLPPGGGFIERTIAMRSRISTNQSLGSTGSASDGEVEDHIVTVQFHVDPQDMVNPDYGDLPDIYKTLHPDGARHVISPTLYLGTNAPDGDANGNPSTDALGDDGSGADDEDALLVSFVDAHAGYDLPLAVRATNAGVGMAYLHVFADWNADGVFNNTDERVEVNVPPGSVDVTFTALFRVPLNASTTQAIAIRLRLSHVKGLAPTGLAPNGEVEDYLASPARQIIDYGDLNDASGTTESSAIGTAPGAVTNLSTITQGNYRTMKYNLGPRHIGRQDLNLCLEPEPPATQVDGEDDAHPNVNADGDDLDIGPLPNGGVSPAPIGGNDESGAYYQLLSQRFDPLNMEFTLMLAASVAVRNETGGPAYLAAFIDGDNDGDFDDADEAAITIVPSGISVTGVGPDYTIVRPDAAGSTNLHTTIPSIPPIAPGSLPPAYHIIFIIKAKLPPVDTGIRGFTKKLPIRLRLSTTSGLGPNNTSLADPIPDGEIQDHIVTFLSSFDNPYPNTTDTIGSGKLPGCYLVDKNSNTRFDGTKHFPPAFSQANDNKWHFENGLVLQGMEPLVPSSMMQNLPCGPVPYFHTASTPDGQIASYWGTVYFKDIGSYRAFMDQANQTSENSVPMGDIDGDGIPNYYEFALGSDPAMSSSKPQLVPRVVTLPGDIRKFELAYLRRAGGMTSGLIYTAPDVRYTPQGSMTLNTWDTPMEVPLLPPSGLPAAPPAYEWGAVRILVPVTDENRGFLRLLIGPP